MMGIPNNTSSKVRYASWLHSSTFLSPNIATVHWNACTYSSLQENVYPMLPQVFMNSGDKIVFTQTVSYQ